MPDLAVVHCVVCGEGSTRTDWQEKPKEAACDKHSAADVKKAIDALKKEEA